MISIIVPIYNVEKYLPGCIDSILNQTYENFELILVDDGSPDGCAAICDAYAEKDNRIKVIHKENGGLSDARNAGLEIISGEYVAFIDSDDWVAPTYLAKLLEALESTGSDICECGFVRTDKEITLPETVQKKDVYKSEKALELLINDNELRQCVWNKLYRRRCVDTVLFEVGKTNEDEFWTYQVFGRANSITKINDVLYFYFQRENSIMGKSYSLKRLDALEAKQQRQIYLEKNFPSLASCGRVNLIMSCIYAEQMVLLFVFGEERKIAEKKIDEILKKNRIKKPDLRNLSIKQKLWLIMSCISLRLMCKIRNILKIGI